MGMFRNSSSTDYATEVKEKTLQKIVKLSYIQSLSVSAGSIDPSSLVTTKGSSKTVNLGTASEKDRSTVGAVVGGVYGGLVGAGAGGVLGGKKVDTSVSATIDETGWSLVKTWLQPEFDIIRYALGIRELAVSQFTYFNVSEMVSKPWLSPKEISKVTLLVDQFIPKSFPPGIYLEYYIKPDTKDSDWIRINSLGTPSQFLPDGNIVPRIITFNADRPSLARIEDSYITTLEPVKSIRFKVIIKRPEDKPSYTPILRSYRLNFSIRNGL
jgi:hypothetical protein